ncbi:discoidin domain-containing protein, partial [Aestuariibaculum suncheonense]
SLFDAQLQLRLYGAYMSASSSKPEYLAKYANDGKSDTRWESESTGAGQWLMLDLGSVEGVSSVVLKEVSNRIGNWELEYWNGTTWVNLVTGNEIGSEKVISFAMVNTRKIRFNILSMISGQESASASLSTFQIATTLSNDNIENLNKSIRIYPNPNRGVFKINLPLTSANTKIDIYDVSGQLIFSRYNILSSRKIEVDISDKSSGIYFLKLNLEKPMFFKLVKE